MSVATTPARPVRKGFFSLDEQLGLQDQRWSEGVVKQVVWSSGLVPYEQAAEILQSVGQVAISGSSAWRLTQKWGQRLVELEQKEQEQANATPQGNEIQRREERQDRHMGLSMDGTMIYIRGEEWKELKVGCLFEVVPCPQLDPKTKEWSEQGHAVHNSYVCHLGGPEEFGKKVWTEAQRRRFLQAVETQVVADGAVWIWNLVADYFYDSYQLVDWYHGSEHLAKAAHLIHAEGTPAAKQWLKDQQTALFQGHADEIADQLTGWAERRPAMREGLLAEAGYFEKHQHRMNYMELREEGWVIGSGMVESGGKQFKSRFCGPGMRWSRKGAESLLPIRTAILSKRFDQRWKAVYNSPKN
jgi:hypothetical protein